MEENKTTDLIPDQKNWIRRHPWLTTFGALILLLVISNLNDPKSTQINNTSQQPNNNTQTQTVPTSTSQSVTTTSVSAPITQKTWHTITTFSGSNNRINTDPFTIKGTQWKIVWSAYANQSFDQGWCTESGCEFFISINSTADSSMIDRIDRQGIKASVNDTSSFYTTGTFYLAVDGDRMSSWNISVEDYY